MWYSGSLCSSCLWPWIFLHKISSWNNKILEYYLPLYARIMDVDIYFYFYDSSCFIPCKDPCCKIGIICRFYRRNNTISIQVSIQKPWAIGTQYIFFVPEQKLKKIGLRKIYIHLGKDCNIFFCHWNQPLTLINFFMTLLIFRIPVVSIVDHHRLFNRGFSFNFVSLVWAVFGGILRYTLKLNITIILFLTLFYF